MFAPAFRVSMPGPRFIVDSLVLLDPWVFNVIEEVIDNVSEEVYNVVLI